MKSSYLRSVLPLLCAVLLSACGGSNNGNLPLSGSITGLEKAGLVLVNKGNGETLPITAGSTSFSFTRLAAVDESFDVEVQTQPTAAICTPSANTGKANAYNAYYIVITCKTNPYTLGGTVTGLRAGNQGLVLANGADTVAVLPPATAGANVSFTFNNMVGDGSAYGVTVLSQPSAQTCSVSPTNNPGTMGSSNKTDLLVTCTPP